jgi:hypothetical protein
VDHGRYARPEPPQQAKLNASMRGKQKLFVRASCGNAIAGDSCGYAGVMHSHAFPDHALSGELIWSPAICVKVKKQQ